MMKINDRKFYNLSQGFLLQKPDGKEKIAKIVFTTKEWRKILKSE
jgi:hypothetical protein